MKEATTIKIKSWVPTKKFFSDGLLIAILTGVGYLSAYAYQFSFLHYFGIPIFFIDVNLGSVLFTTLIGFLFLLNLGMCFDVLISHKLKNKTFNLIKGSCAIFVIFATIVIPILALYLNLGNDVVFVSILIILAALVIGMSIYIPAHPDQFNNKETGRANNLITIAEESFGSFPVRFIAILIFFIIYSGGVGAVVAQSAVVYLVSNTNPELVIVSTYSGNLIGLTFNISTKSFDRDMTLISADKVSNDNIIFYEQSIGPLKPKQTGE